jgi:hypothetical protein
MKRNSEDQAPFLTPRSMQLIIHEGQEEGQPVTQDGKTEPNNI